MKEIMKARLSTGLLCLSLLAALGCGLGWLLSRPATAQAIPAPPPAPAGRYSIAATQGEVYFLDTQTGRLWSRDTGFVINADGHPVKPGWREVVTPASTPGRKPQPPRGR